MERNKQRNDGIDIKSYGMLGWVFGKSMQYFLQKQKDEGEEEGEWMSERGDFYLMVTSGPILFWARALTIVYVHIYRYDA